MDKNIRRKLILNDSFLIGINLIPLAGVLFAGWDIKEMFVVYLLESAILGFFNAIKMIIVTFIKGGEPCLINGDVVKVHGIIFTLFFIAVYSVFMFFTTSLFTAIVNFKDAQSADPISFFFNLPQILSLDGKMVLALFFIVYGIQMISNFIMSGKYNTATFNNLLFQPFNRAMLQQVIVFIGCMMLTFGSGKLFMLVFVVIKLSAEIFISIEHYLKPNDPDYNMDDVQV